VAKKIVGVLKITVPAGKAAPAPPIGPALGQRGLNIMAFCKEFNERTKGLRQGARCPVVITFFHDKSFEFIIKSPLASYLIKEAAGIKSGSATPGRGEKVGTITVEQLKEIAMVKMDDLSAYDLETASKIIMGTARSMGVGVE
jgi:large subunit ribosomal protein L11